MKPRLTLRKSIALTYILLAVVVAGVFSLVTYISISVIEEEVIDARLAGLAPRLIDRHEEGQILDVPTDVRFLVDEAIPEELRKLPAGVYELPIGGRYVRALLRVQGSSRYALIHQVEDLEQTEVIIQLSLAIGFVFSVVLAVLLGVLSVHRTIAPVSALAEAVSRNVGPTELPSLHATDEIGVLSRAFAKRTDELEQFLQRERLFTGDVSHELRTPLTVILGAAEVLSAQLSRQPAQLVTAERIRRVADETAQRVNALLLLSRGPELLDAPETVLNSIIESEMERCWPLLEGKDVQCRLECTGLVSAHVRPELFGIVIGNLLRNACRNTEQGWVCVRLAAGSLVIEDTGTGIPQNVRKRLFERFVHDDDQPVHEGAGLGLSIVKRVIDHIGWDIRLDVSHAGGTRFVLSFPVEPLAELS